MTQEERDFLAEIEQFCQRHGYSASGFGRAFGSDPNFVRRLRSGLSTVSLRRVGIARQWMAQVEQGAVKKPERKKREKRKTVDWTPQTDRTIRLMHKLRSSWAEIADAVNVSYMQAYRRGVELGLTGHRAIRQDSQSTAA